MWNKIGEQLDTYMSFTNPEKSDILIKVFISQEKDQESRIYYSYQYLK